MNRIKAASVCGILAFALAASGLAGCGAVNGSETAITVNGEDLSVGTANFWLRYQQASSYSMMMSYGLASENMWDSEYTASSSAEEDAEPQTYGESIKDSIAEEIENYMVLRQKAADYDVTIPDELQTQIDEAAAAAVEANAEAFKKAGVSEENVAEMLQLLTYSELMFDPMTADTDTEVSDEEAAQSTVTYVRIELNGADGDPTDEEKEAWRQELLDMIAAAKETGDVATADLDAIQDEIDEDAFCFTYSYGADDTSLPDEVKEAAAKLSDGEITEDIIDTGDYYYIVRLDKALDEEKTEAKKVSIVNERKKADYDEMVEAWRGEAEITLSEAWNKLTVTDAEPYELAPQTTEG